ncbi:RICIN domain-containing protein [Ruminococcus sp. XPD3002]|uniref:RICIN domain-containing protein n=1 Tax=Ruminococcus sp. XPD3002 TaxID=1452269 RepID=UPI000917178B|nr:Ricin-type beta-trefoil lectin domain-like [Ruminococcus flavefaciens]
MKNKIKKVFSLIMSCTMLMILFTPSNTMKANAIWCAKDGFDKSRYTLSGNMAEDAATIAKSQKGRFCDDFGYSGVDWGAWCDEYVADCLENAGCDSSIVAHGGTVADFANKMIDRGAVRVSSPEIGDLAFFNWSHVEIVTKVENGKVYTAGGNNNDPDTNTYHDGGCCAGEHETTKNISYYLRPNYGILPQPKWYDDYTPVNLGDGFYAHMICQDNGCYLSNMEGNVGGADPIATKNQIWHFVRQDDGSYAILSYYDDLSMDVYAASTDNATNIQMMPYVGNTAQKFWIYSFNGAYYIRPQCTEYPFTINRQNNDNLEVWYFDPTFTNKRFDIIKMDLDGNMPISIGGDFYAQMVCEDGGSYLSDMEGNVGGADPIGTKNQIWHFKWLNDGSYSITSYYDGLSMDVAGAKTDNATNMQMMPYVGNTAQKFWIYSINGAYYIRSQCNPYPFTINRQNNDNLELWYYDSTFKNKRFDIIKMDCGGNLPINVDGNFNGDFYGKIKCNTNGKYLTNTDNNVVCADDTYNNDQVWHFKWQHDGSYSITSYADEKSMDIYCAKEENGTNVQMMPYVGNTAQRFWIYNMNDAYYIQPLCSALPFTLNGDNLEIWIYDKTFENKKFDIIEVKPYSNVEGDCNNDGKFNVSDVVLLQKWLLAVPDTHFENWKAADMCEDDRLDVFDLCMMKRKLIYV